MIINLSKIDFGGVATGGGNAKPEEVFDVQPTTTEQTITPTAGSVFSRGTVRAVTADIDNNIVSNNIKEGVTILGVVGSHKGEKPEESFNVQPTTAEQTITPTVGSVFSGGTVHAVTSAIDNNIVPENIKEGVSILGVAGTLSSGDTPDYRYAKGTVDRAGLRAIGWTDEDILTYEQNIPPHYPWQNDQYKVSDENKALYLMDNPDPSSYKDNPNITFVPKKNMESYFAKSRGFRDMKYIKGIPFYDTSNMTDTSGLFKNCSQLTTIPQLNFSNVTDASYAFHNCSNLTAIPELDFSSAKIITSLFNGCSGLTTIPQLNFSNVTDASYVFGGCSNLTAIPELDFSNVTDASGLFYGCSKFTTIPLINLSNATAASSLFYNCSSLTAIPELDFSNVTDASSLFYGCKLLTVIPALNTSKAKKAPNLFSGCSGLTTVEGIDFSGLTADLYNLFGYGVGSKITRFIVNGKINVNMSDNYSIKALTAIDYDSVKSILAAADRTDNTNAKELAFNRTIADQNGELAVLVASCTSKGWTISGLTLQ